MAEINWPEVVAGVAVGLLLPLAQKIYFYFRYARSPGRRRYLGDWNSYWRSTTGLGSIGHERLNIRYSFIRNRLIAKVTTTRVGGGTLEYEGTLSERRGTVRYLRLRDRLSHIEEFWVMIDPFYDPIDWAEGVQVTLDMRGLPAATAQLISRSELSPEELERRLPKEIICIDPLKSYLDSMPDLP